LSIALVVLAVSALAGQSLSHDDKVRVGEFYRLADAVQEKVWSGWSRVPAPVLLVTADKEYLFRNSVIPAGFTKQEDGTYARARQFPTTLLATFPAFGQPAVIVVGEPKATEVKTSSDWLLTMMHEHFHQLQYAQPGYYEAVTALGLSHGDQSGMWILNYPFPYERADLNGAFETAKAALLRATSEQDGARWKQAAIDYKKARAAFFALLSPEQARYLEFQLWQEGIARYTEISVSRAALEFKPSDEFARLRDYTALADLFKGREDETLNELRKASLKDWQRVVVYSWGATEGMLLDRLDPEWKKNYFQHPLTMQHYWSH